MKKKFVLGIRCIFKRIYLFVDILLPTKRTLYIKTFESQIFHKIKLQKLPNTYV